MKPLNMHAKFPHLQSKHMNFSKERQCLLIVKKEAESLTTHASSHLKFDLDLKPNGQHYIQQYSLK